MSVYVDNLRKMEPLNVVMERAGFKYGHRWALAWADSDRELFDFAAKMKFKRTWLLDGGDIPRKHFRILPTHHGKTVKLGAVRMDTYADWCRIKQPFPSVYLSSNAYLIALGFGDRKNWVAENMTLDNVKYLANEMKCEYEFDGTRATFYRPKL